MDINKLTEFSLLKKDIEEFRQQSKSSEAVVWRCSAEKVFLEISQYSQEKTCARVSFLIKLHNKVDDSECVMVLL